MVAKLVDRAAAQAFLALEHTDDEVKAGMEQSAKEAPQWTHLLIRMASSAARGEMTKPSTHVTNLNVLIPDRATSSAEWAVEAAGFQAKQLTERRQVIEAQLAKAEETAKK